MNTPVNILQNFLTDAKIALELSLVEMFSAGWNVPDMENVGRELAYDAVYHALTYIKANDAPERVNKENEKLRTALQDIANGTSHHMTIARLALESVASYK